MSKTVVFAYNFPHRKTQEFLLRLFVEGVVVSDVFAADAVELGIPPSTVRTKVRHTALLSPRLVAERVGARYHVVAHDGEAIARLCDEIRPDIGVIAGARILKPPVIDRFAKGIINFHPGLIPEVRGLDAMLWSVRGGFPLGVTAHLIDRRVDAGTVLIREEIALRGDDTAFDISERLYETQLDMLRPAVEAVAAGAHLDVDFAGSAYNRKMPTDLERETLDVLLPRYLEKFEKH